MSTGTCQHPWTINSKCGVCGAVTVRPREQTVGDTDRVTVEAVERAREWLTWFPPQRRVVQTLNAALDAIAVPAEEPDWATCSEHCVLHNPPPSEPPRPELPPARKGWVLTGEWGDPWENGWEYFAGSTRGVPLRTADFTRPNDGPSPRFRLLKVPAPPEEGWVVTKYEKPNDGDRFLSAGGHWMVAQGFATSRAEDRRFIAEQEDRDDDRVRLAKAEAEADGYGPGDDTPLYLARADRLLALGVKAPDPVRLVSL